MHIIGYLAAVHGYRHYLEICTSRTGYRYGELDRQLFVTWRRLMYHCPEDFADGFEIDFRSADFDIDECLQQMASDPIRPDIVLVDPWHEYETSLRDIAKAFDLIADGGTLVVHDCRPPNYAVASPHYVPGDWCGVTYKAYLDFVTGRDDLEFMTVDTDYGCGIVRKRGTNYDQPVMPKRRLELIRRWRNIGDDFALAFRFFEENNRDLLNLVSLGDFIEQHQTER